MKYTRRCVLRKEFNMKPNLLKKAAAFVLSGVMLLTSAHIELPSVLTTGAAANKARVSVHDPSVVKDDGANICQWEFWGGDGQKFILEPAAGMIRLPFGIEWGNIWE